MRKVKIWDFITLSEVCNFEKGKTALMKAKAGEYPLVATGKDRKTCDTYQFDTKAVCVPLVSSTGHGHASLKYVHYQEGKFALGTILVAVIPKDENILNAQFLHIYLSRLKDRILVPLMTGAANVTLTITKLKTVKIPLPPIEEQLKIVSLFNRIDSKQIKLTNEITYQQELLKKLRQSILQEAIEGKLTKDWREKNPNVESVSILLEKIKQEKEQLIKEKKIKNQKPLPPISEDEIPFEIPKSWKWCRLGNIISLKSGNTYKYKISNSGIPYIKVRDMNLKENSYSIEKSSTYFEIDKIKEIDIIPQNSIIFPKRGGAIATNKKKRVLTKKILIDSNTMAIIVPKSLIFNYLYKWFKTLDLATFGNESVIPQVNNKDIKPLLLPLPPLAEQKEIVKKIETLFTICDKLEIEIQSSKKSSSQLIQAVLKEAFEK
ncbi:MAG: hypothetical protein GXO60_09485 [Epsilonproteobacteria bacterium]|nr:hypothetical protein [Campylobacterota bacterium]